MRGPLRCGARPILAAEPSRSAIARWVTGRQAAPPSGRSCVSQLRQPLALAFDDRRRGALDEAGSASSPSHSRPIPCAQVRLAAGVRRRRPVTLQPGHAQAAGRGRRAGRRRLARSQLDRSHPRHRLQVADGRPRSPRAADPPAGATASGIHAPAGTRASVRRLRTPRTTRSGRPTPRPRLAVAVAGRRPAGADEQRLAVVPPGRRRAAAPDLLRHERHDRVQQAQVSASHRRPRSTRSRERSASRRVRRGGARSSPSPGTSRSSRSTRTRSGPA